MSEYPEHPTAETGIRGKELQPEQLVVAGHVEASPEHVAHDTWKVGSVEVNGKKGKRIIVTDGSGGSVRKYKEVNGQLVKVNKADPKDVPMGQDRQDYYIAQQAHVITNNVARFDKLDGAAAIRSANRAAFEARNPAYATVTVVDVFEDGVSINQVGDGGVVFFKEAAQYDHRRADSWGDDPHQRGGPSNFQLQGRVGGNMAQLLKAAGSGEKTHLLDETAAADMIVRAVGEEEDVKVDTTWIPKEQVDADLMLIMTDGGQPASSLLEPTSYYSSKVKGVLEDYLRGPKTHAYLKNASELVARNARTHAGTELQSEMDDITDVIVDLRHK